MSKEGIEIADINTNNELIREPIDNSDEISDSGVSFESEDSEIGDVFVRTLSINLPTERNKKYDYVKKLEDYRIDELYKISFESFNGKHFIEITKMKVPVAKITKNEVAEIKYDVVFDTKKSLDENDEILYLNLGISYDIFNFKSFEYKFHCGKLTNAELFMQLELFFDKNINFEKYQERLKIDQNGYDINKCIMNEYKKFSVCWDKTTMASPKIPLELLFGNGLDNLNYKEFSDFFENERYEEPDYKLLTSNFMSFISLEKIDILDMYTDRLKQNRFYIDIYGLIYNRPNEFFESRIKSMIDFYEENNITVDIYQILILSYGFKIVENYITRTITLPNNNNFDQVYLDDKRNNYEIKDGSIFKPNYLKMFFTYLFSYSVYTYIFYVFICILGQVIAPVYFVIDSFKETFIDCPNEASIITKIFAFVFYIIMQSQLNEQSHNITQKYIAFSMINYNEDDNYGYERGILYYTFFYSSFVINLMVKLIIPIFTFAIFMKNNEIIDLILNCLTGLFLSQLDDIILGYAIPDPEHIKKMCRNYLLKSYMHNGVNKNFQKKIRSFFIICDNVYLLEKIIVIILIILMMKCI